MRITNVTAHPLSARWEDDPWFPAALHSTALIRIETDAGIDGLGETTLGYFAPEVVPSLAAFYKPVLCGQDPMDISLLTRAMYDESVWWARSGAGCSVASGIELALWDLNGKVLGVPVYQLLGGRVRERVPVYASGGPSYWPIEVNARKSTYYAERGYRGAKLSTCFYKRPEEASQGGQGRMEEVPLPFASQIEHISRSIEGIRRECGPAFDLAIDGHQGGVPNPISVAEAIQIADTLTPLRLRFYEEPLAYSDVDGYRELRAQSRIPIAGGESLCRLDQFHPFIAGRGLHVVQPDIGFVGGLLETVRILHHAEAFNLSAAIHTGACMGPAMAASWHLAVAHQSVGWLEHVVAAGSVQRDLLLDEFVISDGQVGLPSSPGLGVQFTPAQLNKYRFVSGSGERT